jgi:hypothetical protein
MLVLPFKPFRFAYIHAMAARVAMTPKKSQLSEHLRQIVIISWKNLLLLRQNKTGLICEIVFSSLFTLVFFVLVYYSIPSYVTKTESSPKEITSQFNSDDTKKNLYYYPDNPFVAGIVNKSMQIMRKASPALNLTLIGTSVKNAELFNDTELSKLFGLVSFPDSYRSNLALPDSIQYSIYTSELFFYFLNIFFKYHPLIIRPF